MIFSPLVSASVLLSLQYARGAVVEQRDCEEVSASNETLYMLPWS